MYELIPILALAAVLAFIGSMRMKKTTGSPTAFMTNTSIIHASDIALGLAPPTVTHSVTPLAVKHRTIAHDDTGKIHYTAHRVTGDGTTDDHRTGQRWRFGGRSTLAASHHDGKRSLVGAST